MKQFLEQINDFKITIFNLMPDWFKDLKYAEYILHAISGTVIYLGLLLFIADDIAFAIVVIIAFAVEFLSEFRKKGTGNFFDAIDVKSGSCTVTPDTGVSVTGSSTSMLPNDKEGIDFNKYRLN